MIRLAAILLFALGIAVPALADEFTRYVLTVPTVQKVQAAGKEIEKKVGNKYKDSKGSEEMDANKFAKLVDSIPEARPILAKHGLSSREFALASFAMVDAGLFLMMEPAADKQEAAKLLATYPAETRGNIELLRKHPELMQRN